MADERTYIRVHDGMPDHPKVDGLSDSAFRLLVTTWCWCSRHLTDGRVPLATWNKRGTAKARRELVAVGLVQVHDDAAMMWDYLEHQRSAAEVALIRADLRSFSAAGNHKRWHVDRGVIDPGCDRCQTAKQSRTGLPHGTPVEDPAREPSGRSPRESTTTETEETTSLRSVVPPQAAKRGTRLPDDFPVTAEMKAWFSERCAGVTDPRTEHEKFCNHWQSKAGRDAVKIDWVKAWKNWMLGAAQGRGPRRPTATPNRYVEQ